MLESSVLYSRLKRTLLHFHIENISQQKFSTAMINKKFHLCTVQLFLTEIYVKTNDSSDILMILWSKIFPHCTTSNTVATHYANNSFVYIVDKHEKICSKLLPINGYHFHILISELLISGVRTLNEHMARLNDVQKMWAIFKFNHIAHLGYLSFRIS